MSMLGGCVTWSLQSSSTFSSAIDDASSSRSVLSMCVLLTLADALPVVWDPPSDPWPITFSYRCSITLRTCSMSLADKRSLYSTFPVVSAFITVSYGHFAAKSSSTSSKYLLQSASDRTWAIPPYTKQFIQQKLFSCRSTRGTVCHPTCASYSKFRQILTTFSIWEIVDHAALTSAILHFGNTISYLLTLLVMLLK